MREKAILVGGPLDGKEVEIIGPTYEHTTIWVNKRGKTKASMTSVYLWRNAGSDGVYRGLFVGYRDKNGGLPCGASTTNQS